MSPPRAETAVDLRLGQIAVRKGKLSADQLKVALEEQAAGVRRGRKKPRRLGVILAEKGWLTDTDVRSLLEEQEAWLLSQETRSREEALLGQVLIDAGLAAPDRVRDGLRIQFDAMEQGEDPPRLGDLLVQRGWARREDVEQAVELKASLSDAPPAEPEPAPVPPPPEPRGVEKIGKYRLVRTIGSGGMGVVYEAEDPDLGRRLALKVLRRDLETGGANAKEVERFLREAQMVARLPKHAGLAEVYETGVNEGRHFIAMELIRGQTFGAWRRSAPRPVRDQVRVLRDVAVAVQHAHDHKILHRDLKPGNILVDPEGRPYVVDFGLARLEGDLALSGAGIVCGTASYMSPEQAEGLADIDHRCDVYALGVMLYEVLSGRTPFAGKDRDEILGKLRSEAVPPPGGFARSRGFSSIDAAVEKICLKALAQDRGKRTATARALAAELTVWLDQSRERKAPPAPKPSLRLPRRAWGAIAGGAALVLLLLAFLLRPAPAPALDPDLKRARTAAEGGRAEEALSIYESILERDPDNPHARQGVDVMRRHLVGEAAAEVDDALSALERARRAGANSAEAQERLDRARERLKKWTE